MDRLTPTWSNQTDEMEQLLSHDDTLIFMLVIHVCLCSVLGLFGIISNTINAVIFVKQGFNSTVNISLFGLAVSDICCLLTLQWLGLGLNPLFTNSNVSIKGVEVMYLTAGWPQKCFSRITSIITAYISAERCLCIMFPLRVRRLVTPTRTTLIICTIYVTMILSILPEYASSYIDEKFFPDENRTLLGLYFTTNRQDVEGLAFVLQAATGVFAFLAVIGFTVVLVCKLRRETRWRKSVTGVGQQQVFMSARDKKTVFMVVLIACVLIICYTPGVVLFTTSFIVPQFSILGHQSNLFRAGWSFAFLAETVNSSVTIILYYKMSSKYVQTFRQIFSKCMTHDTSHGDVSSVHLSH